MKTFVEILNENASKQTLNESYIDLDWASDEYDEPDKDPNIKKYKLKTKLINKKGTLDMPEYRFTGTTDDIKKYLLVYNGGDKMSAEDMYVYINEK